jgi:hypothetical protein
MMPQAPMPMPGTAMPETPQQMMAKQAKSMQQKQIGAAHQPPSLASNGTMNNPQGANTHNQRMKMAGMNGMGGNTSLSGAVMPVLNKILGGF